MPVRPSGTVGRFRMGLGLGGFLTLLRVLSFAVLVGSEPMDGHPL
jgi:hypothetical protein